MWTCVFLRNLALNCGNIQSLPLQVDKGNQTTVDQSNDLLTESDVLRFSSTIKKLMI